MPSDAVRCRCDACTTIKSAGSAWSEDGYCSFCATQCHLPMTGKMGKGAPTLSRASLPRELRLNLHASASRPVMPNQQGPQIDYPERGILDLAISSIDDRRTRRKAQVVLSLAEALTPTVAPQAKKAISLLKKVWK